MESQNICKFSHSVSGDLICSDFVYESDNARGFGSTCTRHILGLVTEGEGEYVQGGEVRPLVRGSLFFAERDTPYPVRGKAGFAYLYISFYGRRADELVERICLGGENAVFDTKEQGEHLREFALGCLHRAKPENLDMLSESVLLYLLSHICAAQPKNTDLLARMLSRTNECFDSAEFSLSTLAAELGYDAKYLSFLFKKKKGICYTQYLRDLRVRHALFLMEQGVVSVKNIAILAGFGDALYFSKVFKQVTGKSPRAYIEELEG